MAEMTARHVAPAFCRAGGGWGLIARRPSMTTLRLLVVSAVVLSAAAMAHAQAAPRRVAVVPLQNLRNDASMDWVGSGTAETLTTKLAAVKGLVMIEKTQVARVLREQDIKISQTDDVNVASKLGKLICAERLVLGSFAKAGSDILFNVRVVDVDTGVVLNTASVRTSEAKIFDAMFELAEAVILSFDKKVVVVNKTPTAADAPKGERLELTDAQRQLLNEAGTSSYQALEAWSKAVDLEQSKPEEAFRLATNAIELDPNFAFAYGSLARACMTLSRYDRAIVEFTKGLRLLPKECSYLSGRAQAYAYLGMFDKAMADIDRAMTINDQAAYVYDSRALTLAQQGHFKEALTDISHAIELDPSIPGRYSMRSQFHAFSGNMDKALADAKQAIKTGPSDTSGYFARALVYKRSRQYDQALADYTKAIELSPTNAQAYYNRGNIWYAKDDCDRALADYTKATEIHPLYFDAWKFRGVCHYNKNELVKALADLDKAVSINSQEGPVRDFRAKTHYQLGNYAKAWDDIQKAEKLGVEFDAQFKNAVRNAMQRQ